MMTGPILCLACTRRHHSGYPLATCDAYPRGIPPAIIDGADHRQPRGDEVNGIVFEAVSTPNADVVLPAWEAVYGGTP